MIKASAATEHKIKGQIGHPAACMIEITSVLSALWREKTGLRRGGLWPRRPTAFLADAAPWHTDLPHPTTTAAHPWSMAPADEAGFPPPLWITLWVSGPAALKTRDFTASGTLCLIFEQA
jgi:hypothetical protein